MKASELIIGECYRINFISFRFAGIKYNYVCSTGYYLFGTIYKLDTISVLYYVDNIDDYELISFTDIIDYLPKNNPDKIAFIRKKKIKLLINS